MNEEEKGEETTKYGEFVTSYFAWVSMPKQKEIVEKLEKATKKEKSKENDKDYNSEQ